MLDKHFGISLSSKRAGVFQYQPKLDKLTWDDECYSIFGQSVEGFSATFQNWISCIYPKDSARIAESYQQQLSRRSSIQLHYRILTPDGKVKHISTLANCLRDDQGQIEHVVGFHVDETNLNKTHRSLRDIQFAMDQVGIGIHFVRPDGYFDYVNEAACNLLDYTREEMLTMAVWDIDPNFEAEGFDEATKAMREEAGRLETIQITRDGRRIPVEVTFRFIDGVVEKDGYFVSFIVDLSERLRVEEESIRLQHQVLQAQKMESIGHLAGGIAHDFNNMLGAILGYAELTKQLVTQDSLDVKQGIRFVEEILSAGNRAKELVAQMLLFSRRVPVDAQTEVPAILIQPVVKEVINLLRSSIPSSIEINYQIDSADLKCEILPVQLHQVLLNLGINAADAIDAYGKIDIKIARENANRECTSCHNEVAGDYIVISVDDNGKGIQDELIPRICEPFFTTKDVGQGTGMGLSVVHGIVHSAGGHLSISNREEGGLSVKIFLPLIERMEREIMIDTESTIQTKVIELPDVNVLVVDDESAITSMLDVLLSTYGANVTCFNRPDEALAEFTNNPHKFDIVISDVTMPSLSGIDIAQGVHIARPDVPIILCSGYTNSFTPEMLERYNIADFLSKPVDFERLIRRIRELVK